MEVLHQCRQCWTRTECCQYQLNLETGTKIRNRLNTNNLMEISRSNLFAEK